MDGIFEWALRTACITMSVILFVMWSDIEIKDWDQDRTSFKVWITIVVLMIVGVVGVLVWAWLPVVAMIASELQAAILLESGSA